VLADRNVDAVLVLNCPTAVTSSIDAADALIGVARQAPRVPLLAGWIGESEEAASARQHLVRAGLPVFGTPGEAVEAFMRLVRYRRGQQQLMQVPPSIPAEFSPEPEAAAKVIAEALTDGRRWLTPFEVRRVLAAYDIPVTQADVAADAEAAGALAERLVGPVALKILSPDILHKGDVGGVVLNLQGAPAVIAAARQMLTRVSKKMPAARVEGFIVEEMIRRPQSQELILGIVDDAQFGPVVLFGHGGVAVEVLRDKALGLPPLNLALAHGLMAETRVFRLLQGYRDRPAANLDAVALALVKLSQLAIDQPQVVELDINPLIADAQGVLALDARIAVAPARVPAERRLAIRPYPRALESQAAARDGRGFLLRPILPEDEPSLHRFFASLSAQSVRLRFFSPLKTLSPQMAARLTQIDYDREMALVLADAGPAGRAQLHAVVRLAADPDNERAEFAIVVQDDLAGQGLGSLLMRRILDYARQRGIAEVFGRVLRENTAMLDLAQRLGFARRMDPDDPDVLLVSLRLAPPA